MNELLEFLRKNPGVNVNLVYNDGTYKHLNDGLTITVKPDETEPITWLEASVDRYSLQQHGFRDAFISDRLEDLSKDL